MKTVLWPLVCLAVVLVLGCAGAVEPSGYRGTAVLVAGVTGHGSGVQVGRELVLTARHVAVMGHTEPLAATYLDGTAFSLGTALIKAELEPDVALLRTLPRPGKLPEVVCEADVKVGDAMVVIGSPGSEMRWAEFHGTVPYVSEDRVYLQMPVFSGASGGPVYDRDGRVVAIVTEMMGAMVSPFLPVIPFGIARAQRLPKWICEAIARG